MAKKTNGYSYWQKVIKAAIKYRDRCVNADDFKTYADYFRGRFYKDKKKTDRIDVNMVYANTVLMSAALASQDPWIAFKARNENKKNQEIICEHGLNNTFKDIEIKHTTKKACRNAQLFGYGVSKTGYNLDATMTEAKINKSKKEKSDQPETPDFDIHIKKESAYVKLVDSKNLILDPTSTEGIKDSKFLIEVILKQKASICETYGIKEDEISGGVPVFLKEKYDEMDKETREIFEMSYLYEIWDIVNEMRGIMIEGYTKKIFWYDWPEYLIMDHEPIYAHDLLIFNDSPGEPYGISDVSLYRTQQEELNITRSMEAEEVKANQAKWEVEEESMSPKEIKKFADGGTNTIVSVKKRGAIGPIARHEFPMDFSSYEARIQNDIREVMGIADFMRGGQQQRGKKTATEQQATTLFAQTRIGERQEAVNEFILSIAKKVFNIMQKEYDIPKYIRLTGADGKYIAQQYTRTDLSGEFDLEIQQGTGVLNRPYLSQMFEKASQFLLGNPLIDPNDFTDLVIDVYLDGLDTSKLKIPNAEEIMKDPIKREQWRQMMLSISGQNMLKLATKALQGGEQKETPPIPGGEAQPGQPPTPQVDNTGDLQAPQLVKTGGVNV